MTSLRRPAAILAVAALAAAASACSDQGTTPTTDDAATPVTLGLTYVPDIQFAPFYTALEAGYYAQAGLDVTLRHHGGSEGLFTAVEQGEEDLVVASGDEVLAQRAAGGDLAQLVTVYADSPVALIAPQDPEGGSVLDDLAGTTIGVPGEFGSTWLGLQMLLADRGLSTDDVDVQVIGYTQTTALLTGQVDAVMGFANGDAVRIAAAGTPVETVLVTDLVSIGVAVPDATDLTDEQLAAFREATMRGAADVVADPEAAVETAASHIPGMTQQAKDDALAVLEATVPLLGTTGETDPARWDAMAQAMLAAGMIEQVPTGGYRTASD